MAKIRFKGLDPAREAASEALLNMKYIDLKIACIVRGILFEDVVNGSVPSLSSFFIKNFDKPIDRSLLEDFDIWMDEQLEKKGYEKDDPIRKYRLSTTLNEEEDVRVDNKKLRKAGIRKKPKPKAQRDEVFNIFKGTKKAYTYSLTSKSLDNKEIIKLVVEKFPEAKPKSIMIWIKRCKDELKEKNS